MIAGVLLKNFKSYSNVSFIPFIEHPLEQVTVFVGENGVGKSTLIEAVNCFLQQIPPFEWDITVDINGKSTANRTGAFVGVVFLIKKSECVEAESLKLSHISNSFWTMDFSKSWPSNGVKNFEKWRKKLLDQQLINDYYLLIIGKNYDNEVKLTTFAHDRIISQNKVKGFSKERLAAIHDYILKKYGYIYIPVENRVSDVLRLQALELQELMNKKIVDEISNIFESNSIKSDNSEISIVKLINENLKSYINDINSDLSSGYRFDSLGDEENEIKTSDVINLVFREYFSKNILKKDGKNIKSLSSGQQRLALIDVVATILNKNYSRSKKICLALDEPENSLDNSNRLNQFSKLFDLASINENQILITTHWYGLLLKPVNGRLIYIEQLADENADDFIGDESLVAENSGYNFRSFSLLNLYDQRRNFPDSIEMKSYFDLMASLWSIIRKSQQNWIVCEGYEDYQYLNAYLGDKINNLRILPINGCGNVKKFYELIRVPVFEKGEGGDIKGRVFCLIDNDTNLVRVEGYKPHKNLVFKKFLLSKNGNELRLASISELDARRTTIEDVLDVDVFIKCFDELCDIDENLKRIRHKFGYVNNSPFVDASEKLLFLDSEKISKADEEIIKTALSKDSNKKFIADSYILKINKDNKKILNWHQDIIDFFK